VTLVFCLPGVNVSGADCDRVPWLQDSRLRRHPLAGRGRHEIHFVLDGEDPNIGRRQGERGEDEPGSIAPTRPDASSARL
jgi:hypothetical protein